MCSICSLSNYILSWTKVAVFGYFRYLDSKPQYWSSVHSVVVKDIVRLNQMNMALYVNHTINFQNYGEKSCRRTELVLQLKKIFEELDIKYHLLPQEVHLKSVDSTPTKFPTTMRWQSPFFRTGLCILLQVCTCVLSFLLAQLIYVLASWKYAPWTSTRPCILFAWLVLQLFSSLTSDAIEWANH